MCTCRLSLSSASFPVLPHLSCTVCDIGGAAVNYYKFNEFISQSKATWLICAHALVLGMMSDFVGQKYMDYLCRAHLCCAHTPGVGLSGYKADLAVRNVSTVGMNKLALRRLVKRLFEALQGTS